MSATRDDLGTFSLVGGTLVDPARHSSRQSHLTIADGRIRSTQTPTGRQADVNGKFILPGLIDMHTHLMPSLVGGREITDDVFVGSRALLDQAVSSGVTSVRDLGGPLAELLALRQGHTSGARMFISGPVVTVPGGHGTHSGHGVAVATPSDAVALVEALAEAKVDQLKIVTSGARGQIQMQPAIFDAAVAVARANGLPVAVHAHFQLEQLERAIYASVASIEHGFMLNRRQDLLLAMADREIALCPTLRVIESIRSDENWFGQQLIPQAWDDAISTTRTAAEAGVKLIAGTDFGVFGVGIADVWREISLISNCVGSRWSGLKAATSDAALVLRRPDLGHLGDGAAADVLVLNRNPVEEELNSSDVSAVIVRGELVFGEIEIRIEYGHD